MDNSDLPNLTPEIDLDDLKSCEDPGVELGFVVDPYDDSGAGSLL